jgi:hypothetical protein
MFSWLPNKKAPAKFIENHHSYSTLTPTGAINFAVAFLFAYTRTFKNLYINCSRFHLLNTMKVVL